MQRLHVGIRESFSRSASERLGTLAIKSLTPEYKGCASLPDVARVSIQTTRDRLEQATWYAKDFGNGAPWGVHVRRRDDLHDVPNEAVKLLDAKKSIITLSKLLSRDVTAILRAGLAAARGPGSLLSSDWLVVWDSFMRDVRSAVEHPSASAVDTIDRGSIKDFLVDMLKNNLDLRNPGGTDFDMSLRIFVSQLQYRLEGYGASGGKTQTSVSWKWMHLDGRSVNQEQCQKVSPDVEANSTEACLDQCRSLRPQECRDNACKKGRITSSGKLQPVCTWPARTLKKACAHCGIASVGRTFHTWTGTRFQP
jgi:hypothetical protein